MMLHSDIPVWENMQVAAGVSNRDGLVMYFELECTALHVCPVVGPNMYEKLYGLLL